MTPPLFLVDELSVDDRLPLGGTVELTGPEGRHAATVRRIRVGEAVLLGDGRGGLAAGRVRDVGRDRLVVEVLEREQVAPPALTVVLAQALIKGDRGELAVELATEAGVDAVLPWRAARCVARWDGGPRGRRALDRWRAAARAAGKQARRAWLPFVEEPVSTGGLAERAARSAVALVLHESANLPLADVSLPAAGDVLLIVGPEGGISPDELAELGAAGAIAVRLGPDVLRASTAGVVALGALGVLTGRWSC